MVSLVDVAVSAGLSTLVSVVTSAGLAPTFSSVSTKGAFTLLAPTNAAFTALSAANANLSYTRIYAPIDGVVTDRQIDPGQTVAASFTRVPVAAAWIGGGSLTISWNRGATPRSGAIRSTTVPVIGATFQPAVA